MPIASRNSGSNKETSGTLDSLFNFLARRAINTDWSAIRSRLTLSLIAEMTCRISAKYLFRIKVHLAAEAAANVWRDQMQAMFRPAQRFGEPAL